MKSHSWMLPAVLALAGAAIFLPALGEERSVTGDEARHAEIAREMAMTGDYAVPQYCGRIYIDKPPLFNWTVAALFKLTGRVNFALARLPSALCSIAAMLGIYFLGRRWLSARAGVCAALIWATSWLVVEWGRFCMMDMMMTCLILYAVLLADVAAAQERWTWRLAAWMGVCTLVAAATMTKGPPALLYFFVAVVCIWRARRGRWLPSVPLLVLVLAVTAAAWTAWLLRAEALHPGHFRDLLDYQFGEGPTEHRARITLYFDQILLRTAPWGIFAVGAVWWSVRRVRRYGYDLATAPALFLLVCLGLMTLFPSKREHYLLPVLPMWSLLIGNYLDRVLALRAGTPDAREGERTPQWMFDWPLRFCMVLFLWGLVMLGLFLAGDFGVITLICVAVGVLALYGFAAASSAAAFGMRREWGARRGRALTTLFSICFLVMAAMYPLTLKAFNPPMKDLVELRRAAEAIPAGAAVADLDVRNPYLSFKLNRPMVYVEDAQAAARFLGEPGPRCLVLSSAAAEKVKTLTARSVRGSGLYYIAEKRSMIVLESGNESNGQ